MHLLAGTIMARHSDFIAILLAWLGLIAGAVAWSINTQWGQIAPYADCASRLPTAALISFAGASVALLGSISSWHSQSFVRHPNNEPATVWRFVGLVSALAALIFAFALAMQGAASLIVNPCDR
jgi:hypothetical protein